MKFPKLMQAIILIVAAYLVLKYAIRPPIPASLLKMYMFFIIGGILLYFTFTEKSARAMASPIKSLLADADKKALRWIVFFIVPPLAAYAAYKNTIQELEPPVELRAIHPAPPTNAKIFGKAYNLLKLENPLRKDKANYEKYAAEGGAIYFQQCFYCHGDKLDGKGHFGAGFNPPPADFVDVGTIAQLQESYLFWRIATGGPGLPREAAPWISAMPAWEKFISEDDIWKVIIFLYDYTGHIPRSWE